MYSSRLFEDFILIDKRWKVSRDRIIIIYGFLDVYLFNLKKINLEFLKYMLLNI